MSCNLTFKIGDTFEVPMQFLNDDEPITITSDMAFSANIVNVKGEVVANTTITPYDDQNNFKGFLLISVADTSSWETGILTLDIKYEHQGKVKHSKDLQFKVVRSIT